MIKHLATEVVVIGGGIMGASTALFLRQHGVNVVMLERDLCGSRSSGVNFGGVRRQGRSLAMLPLSQRSHALWGRLTELIGTEAEYERSGGGLRISAKQLNVFTHRSFQYIVVRQSSTGRQAQLLDGPLLGRPPFQAFLHHHACGGVGDFPGHFTIHSAPL